MSGYVSRETFQRGWQHGKQSSLTRAFFILKENEKMLDIKLIRENPELVKENMRKKFQDSKLNLVDEVFELDAKYRQTKTRADELRGLRNKLSKQIGVLMGQKKFDEAEDIKRQVQELAIELTQIEASEEPLQQEIRQRMLVIPNIIDETVPLGKDDSENVERQKIGEPALKPLDRKSVV